jgi:hypothetical protein
MRDDGSGRDAAQRPEQEDAREDEPRDEPRPPGHGATSIGTPEDVDTRVTLALLDGALRLTDGEHAAVQAVLAKNAPEHTRLRETIEPGLAAMRAKEREEIRAVLAPDRQARLDKILDHLDERRRRVGRLLDH